MTAAHPDDPDDATAPGDQPVALDLRDHVLFDPDAPRTQPIAAGMHLGLQLVCLEPRQSLPAVTLDGDRLYTVIGGRAWAVVDDAEVGLDPLQALLVPAGAAHGVRNDSADPLILQVVDAPAHGASAAATPPGAAALSPSTPTTSLARSAPTPPVAPPPGPPATPAARTEPGRDASPPTRDRFARLRKLLGSGD